MPKFILSLSILSMIATNFMSVSAADFKRAAPLAAAGQFEEAAKALLSVDGIGRVPMTQRRELAAAFQDAHETFSRRGELQLLHRINAHARKIFPTERASAVNLAEVLITLGEFEPATAVLKESLDQRNIHYPPRADINLHADIMLARASLAIGNLEDAVEAVKRAETAGPESAVAFYTKAQVMIRTADHEAAADAIARAFALDARAAQPVDYLIKATAHKQNNDLDLAQRTLQDAIKRYPAAAGLHYGLGQVFLARRAIDPEDKTPWVARAFYLFQHEMMLSGPDSSYSREAGNMVEIITALLDEEEEPESFLRIAYGAVALLNMKPGGHERALEHIEMAMRLIGDDCLPLQMLRGHAHTALGNHEQAAAAFRNALRVDPYFAPAYIDLGDTLIRLEMKDQALEMYARGMSIDRDNWRVKEMLQRMQ